MINKVLHTEQSLTTKRQQGDEIADAFIGEVFKFDESKKELQEWLKQLVDNTQLDSLPAVYANALVIANANKLPLWANARMMRTGSNFFIRNSEMIMSLLGLLSLPYCYTAANGAMVLYLSDRMRNDTTNRLYQTGSFVWEVMAPDAFVSGGKGFASILKVRLMHAAVRYYTLQSGKWNPVWGLPVNQEDMAGTNLSFSLIVIRGLRKLGISVSETDQEGFMHLWSVIGYFSGLTDDMIPATAKEAQILDTAISTRQFEVSAHGQILTKSLTDHITSINNSKVSADEILGLMRYLLGRQVADMLSIKAPELPALKLTLIKTINLFKSFKPQANSLNTYREAYYQFKKQKPLPSAV